MVSLDNLQWISDIPGMSYTPRDTITIELRKIYIKILYMY